MIKRADWEAAYRELIAEGRRRCDDPPTEDQLFAYSRGELDDEEATRVQEYLSYYPEIARALVEPFPPVEESRPGDTDYLTDEMLEQDWNAIQARLAAVPAPVTPLVVGPKSRRWRELAAFLRDLLTPWKLATAGAFGLAAVLAIFAFQTRIDYQRLAQKISEPHINPERRLLLPDGERDAAGEAPILLRSHADNYLLVLDVSYRSSYPEYRLRIVEVDGTREKEVWSAAGLRRDGDTFEILVPRTFLEAGERQRLEVYGVRAGKTELLAAYTVELQDS